MLQKNPSHWAEVPIGEILKYRDEQVVFDDMTEYITITVKRRHGGLEAREKLFGHEIKTKKQYRLHRGAFIISRVQCWHAAFAIVPHDIPDNMIASQNYDQFEISPKVDERFFWWLSHSPQFIETVRSSASGVVIEKLVFNRDAWLQKTIPLPPLDEQRRIVARVEAFADRIAKAQSLREDSNDNFHVLHTIIMKAACEGKLVTQDVNDLPMKDYLLRLGKSTLTTPSLPSLPNGWCWVRAEEICDFITKGTTPSADKLYGGSGEIPFIKVYNLTFDGTLNFSFNPTFVSVETHKGELARSKVFPGDVLMNIVGPPLGKVSIVPDTYPEWNMNQAIVRFRPLEFCDRKYLSIVLRTENILNRAIELAKGTAGQANLTLEICRNLPIPLPPLDEQRRIVAYLDSVQARLASLRELQSATGEELDALLPSVLDKAFKGEL